MRPQMSRQKSDTLFFCRKALELQGKVEESESLGPKNSVTLLTEELILALREFQTDCSDVLSGT